MNEELMNGFERELTDLKQRIIEARAELEDSEDAEVAGLSRFKISLLEQVLASLEVTKNQFVLVDFAIEQKIEQFKKWREAVQVVRVTKAAYEAFTESQLLEFQTNVETAEKNFFNAEARLTEFLSHPLSDPDFRPRGAVRKWDAEKVALEEAVKEKSAELRGAKEALRQFRGEVLTAQGAYEAALFRERHSRLPQATERTQSMGALSGVH